MTLISPGSGSGSDPGPSPMVVSSDEAQAWTMETDTSHNETPEPVLAGPGGTHPGLGAPAGYRLHRSRKHGVLAGVAAGIADYFNVDPTLVRLGFVGLALLGGLAVPLYLAGWLLIPDEGTSSSVLEELLAREPAR